jgi:hypothetical protein
MCFIAKNNQNRQIEIGRPDHELHSLQLRKLVLNTGFSAQNLRLFNTLRIRICFFEFS